MLICPLPICCRSTKLVHEYRNQTTPLRGVNRNRSTNRENRDGLRLHRGTGLASLREILDFQRHHRQPSLSLERGGWRHPVPQAELHGKRQHLRPRGSAPHLRTCHQPRHPHRARWQHHSTRYALRWQGIEQPQRYRGEKRRQHLLHRPQFRQKRGLRHSARSTTAVSGSLPPRPRYQLTRAARGRLFQAERLMLLARRKAAFRQRLGTPTYSRVRCSR